MYAIRSYYAAPGDIANDRVGGRRRAAGREFDEEIGGVSHADFQDRRVEGPFRGVFLRAIAFMMGESGMGNGLFGIVRLFFLETALRLVLLQPSYNFV